MFGLAASLTSRVLVENCLRFEKEYKLEVMTYERLGADNVNIVGVHNGDSSTVAPPHTLADEEYQCRTDDLIAVIKLIEVGCGGPTIQIAVNPEDGEVLVTEMNSRVLRSLALASKATGFPIARMAAKLSFGLLLDQIAFAAKSTGKETRLKRLSLGATLTLNELMNVAQNLTPTLLKDPGYKTIMMNSYPEAYTECDAIPTIHNCQTFLGLGFRIVSTSGTEYVLELDGIPVERVLNMHEGQPHTLTTLTRSMGWKLRRMVLAYKVPIVTIVSGALATAHVIRSLECSKVEMIALHEYCDNNEDAVACFEVKNMK
ncbi:hypothetical protein RJ640_012403, partial [Escallonia rubra]